MPQETLEDLAVEETPEKTETNVEEADPRSEALVSLKFPPKDGFIRRIAFLWGPYFRVNFINEETGTIPESHFLKAKEGNVEVIPDSEKLKR